MLSIHTSAMEGPAPTLTAATRIWDTAVLQRAILRYSTRSTLARMLRTSRSTFKRVVRVLYSEIRFGQMQQVVDSQSSVSGPHPVLECGTHTDKLEPCG